MAKKIRACGFVLLWMLILCVLGAYYLFFAPRTGEYSPEENRNLTGFPTLSAESVFGGTFSKEVENYLLDHFPGRNRVISFTNHFNAALSMASHEEYLRIAQGPTDPLDSGDYQAAVDELVGQLGMQPTQPSQPGETTPETNRENPPIVQKPPAALEDYPTMMGHHMNIGKGDSLITGYSRNNVAAVTVVLNKYAALLPENGKLMFTVVPQSQYASQFINSSQKDRFWSSWDELINGLGANNVYAFDTAQILQDPIKAGEYVYFRTDMHWNPYGSYLVYREMAQQAGKTPCSYTDDFDITVETPFRGTYYRDMPGNYAYVQPDTLDLLMPKAALQWRRINGPDSFFEIEFLNFNARQNDRYTVYLGGPAGPWTYAEIDNGQEENCLVLTDSFGLGFVPFLTTNYKQVHYYDPRYFNQAVVGGSVADMIRKYNIQDIYVVVGDLHSFNSNFLVGYANDQLGS